MPATASARGSCRTPASCGHGTRAAPQTGRPALGRCPDGVAGPCAGRGRAPQRGALRGPDATGVRQFFLAGTAVGSVRLAVRARVTGVEVPVAGAFLAAAGVALRTGAAFTGVAARAAAF